VRALWVVPSAKSALDTHGLYYTDRGGQDHLVERDHWNDNYGITKDGRWIVTTTWDGEAVAWSTERLEPVYRHKIASAYGYLAYDERGERFLLGDATHDGTTKLRALVVPSP
jgi:hypothetical protein